MPAREVAATALRGRTFDLLLVSVLGLFLELALIRWVGTEVRIFAYLQNMVLVVCFLGLGMGCFSAAQPAPVTRVFLPLLALAAALAIPQSRDLLHRITQLVSGSGGLLIWHKRGEAGFGSAALDLAIGLGLVFVLCVGLWECFLPIGRLLGRRLGEHPRPILAYSVNVAGSLLGIWLFVGLSALRLPPPAWFAVAAALALPLTVRSGTRAGAALAVMAATIALSACSGRPEDALETIWSPYQKLALRATSDRQDIGRYVLTVNDVRYQALVDAREATARARPDMYPAIQRGLSQYDLPLRFHPHPRRMLVVGAGTGNDVAGALRAGVDSVTAVEIDPVILDLGRRFHPEHPYDDPRVRMVVDDARAFFANCADRFDVISFGLLDSHTTGAMTNARLDHYVYTEESLGQAKKLLADGGVLVLSFEPQKPFIASRMAVSLAKIFGHEPLCFRVPSSGYGWGGVLFVTGDEATVRDRLAGDVALAAHVRMLQERVPVPLIATTTVLTDDWPYIYLEERAIPWLYWLMAALMAALALYARWRLGGAGLGLPRNRSGLHFFFLGAAFLLLEVQNISKAAVALGSTWQVNAVIMTGILAMILLANLAAWRWPRLPEGLVYLLLVAVCHALYFADIARLAFLPYGWRACAVGGLTTLPMLFSGVIFARSFAAAKDKSAALGANLIGALVGGLLQSVTFVTGVKALLLIVAGLYGCAYLARPELADGMGTGDPA